MLPPLLLGILRRDNREEVRSVGLDVPIHYLLQESGHTDGFLLAVHFRSIGEDSVFYIVLGEVEQISASHAFGEHSEEEEVASE